METFFRKKEKKEKRENFWNFKRYVFIADTKVLRKWFTS